MWKCKLCGSTHVVGTGTYKGYITYKEGWQGDERYIIEVEQCDPEECVEREYSCFDCGGEVELVEPAPQA